MEDNNNLFENTMNLTELSEKVAQVKSEIQKIIVGQEKMVEQLIVAMLSDGHVLIEGVPGVAKTLTAKLISKTINADFSRIQFTPDLMPSDILGTSIYNLKTSEFEYKNGPIFSNIVLIDEINRAPAKTQAALFEVMEERQITNDGERFVLEPPFIVIATQNPIEQEGTYRLPEAQLDRFLFKINVTYPNLENEIKIISDFHARNNQNNLEVIQKIIDKSTLATLREKVRAIKIEEKLIEYIAEIVNQTRIDSDIYLGASPRASLAILTASKAYAAINGRDFVVPEDIMEMFVPVLAHRIVLSPEKEMEGASASDVIREIIQKKDIPR